MAAFSTCSLYTSELLVTIARAFVVGIFRPCIAIEHKYSRILDLRTARPSAPRENGEVPAPFNDNSLPSNSPIKHERPSPS